MNPHGRRAAKAQTPPGLPLNRHIRHLSLTLRDCLFLTQESSGSSALRAWKLKERETKLRMFIVAVQIKPCSEWCVDVLG